MKGRVVQCDWVRLLAGRNVAELSRQSGVPYCTIRDLAKGRWNDTGYAKGHRALAAAGLDVMPYGPTPPWQLVIKAMQDGGLARVWIARKIGVTSQLVDFLAQGRSKEPMYTNGHNILVLYQHLLPGGFIEDVL